MNRVLRTYQARQTDRAVNEAWVALVNQAMPQYVRTRQRGEDEARLLRERGTSERLIGPSRAV
jgi:hypothetical protein